MGPFDKASLISEVKKTVSDSIDLSKDISDEEIRELITNVVFEKSKQTYLTVSEKREISEAVFNSMRRLDILQPLIDDPSITEIMINGANDIFIERDGRIEQFEAKFESSQKLEDVIQSIVSKVNRTVNEATPIVDARLSNGSRVNVVLPPIALNGA